MKTEGLEIRPLYLRRANRRQAHAFVCLPSLKTLREMEQRRQGAFATTERNRESVTVEHALSALAVWVWRLPGGRGVGAAAVCGTRRTA